MANNGEIGAAAPGAARRFSPYDAAAPAAGTTAAPTVVIGGQVSGSDPSPGHASFAAAFNSGSPLERLASEGRWMRAQVAPIAMGVSTPPTRTSGTKNPPQTMEPPTAGCSIEDLRLYVLQVVERQSLDVTQLEVRFTESVNPITRALEELNTESQAVKRDVSVFTTIKTYVTNTELETRTASINEDLKLLTSQTKCFA
jgi:hypothetical protein